MLFNFIKNKTFWLIFILIVILIFSALILKQQTKADILYFYPQTCLGSFVNPEKAQGEREVGDPNLINELNSAVYYGGFKEIYCGNFRGSIKEGEIKKVKLYFNWILTKELKEKPVIEQTLSESFIEKILPSKTIEINIGTSNFPTEDNTDNHEINTNGDELNNTNGNEINSNKINTNSNEIGISISSKIFKFINFAFAQTEIITEIQTSTSRLKTLFDIHYTLDGQNWYYLGSINEYNWQNISFDIPVNNWLDISKIQIKINSLPDTDHFLYLESMWLEVEYISDVKEIVKDDTSILNKSLALDSNFEYQRLIKVKGVSNNKILAVLDKGEIWLFDLIYEKQIKISEDINPDFDIGIKNDYAFWLSKDKNKIYYLNLNDLIIKEYVLETSDFSQRIYLNLPDINFTVVLEGSNFYFQLPQIGEVFSDENSIVKDNFIKVFGLNKLLDEENLNNLGYYEATSE